ncbi:MAG: hypothetical protein IJD92_02975 [Bacilli bacterium]|nr:hypothetical protein [Bacilli bacterium]
MILKYFEKFFNHKFKKYIINYEIKNNKIKIINSYGEFKEVDNNVKNKVKVMEVISDHKKEITEKINYYDNKRNDYIFIIFSSLLFILFLGFICLFSFFTGSYIFLLLSIVSFSISLVVFSSNLYNILLFRKEVKRLVNAIENKNFADNNEFKEIILDSFIFVKNYIYNVLIKIISLFENIKVKFN